MSVGDNKCKCRTKCSEFNCACRLAFDIADWESNDEEMETKDDNKCIKCGKEKETKQLLLEEV
jgi:hypothetical protein